MKSILQVNISFYISILQQKYLSRCQCTAKTLKTKHKILKPKLRYWLFYCLKIFNAPGCLWLLQLFSFRKLSSTESDTCGICNKFLDPKVWLIFQFNKLSSCTVTGSTSVFVCFLIWLPTSSLNYEDSYVSLKSSYSGVSFSEKFDHIHSR